MKGAKMKGWALVGAMALVGTMASSAMAIEAFQERFEWGDLSKPTTLHARVAVTDPYDKAVWVNVAVFGGNAESGYYWQKYFPGKNIKMYPLFGIQYWNTTAPAEVGDPPGRASDDRIQTLPETMASCCAWGYQGGTEKNAAYDGWYTPQTTVRLVVKDKALMDQLTKASQDLVAMELQVSGHTVTGFKLLN